MSAPHAGGGAGRKHSDSHSETRQPKASRNKLQASKRTPFKMLFAAPRNNEIVARKRCQFLPRSGSGSTKKRRKNKNNVWGRSFYERSSTFSCFFLF